MNQFTTQNGCDPSCIHVVVDANDIFKTTADHLGRPPGGNESERIDYAHRLPSLAEHPDPQRRQSMRKPSLEFFDLQRGFHIGNPFYDRLESEGYRLHLTPKSHNAFREHQDAVLQRLAEIERECDCPILFAAGGSRDYRMRDKLIEMSQRRDIYLLHFSKSTQFQNQELEAFAGTLGLVEEGVAPKAVYGQLGMPTNDHRRLPSVPVASAASAQDLQETAMSLAMTEAQQMADQTDTNPLQLAPDEEESDMAATVATQADSTEVPDPDQYEEEVAPLLVLIDVENIDAVQYEILDGTLELDSESRPQWDRLARWLEDGWGESTLVAPVLQRTSTKIDRFASYLASRGFRPIVVEPQDDQKVVDKVILKLLGAMLAYRGDVMLISNDGDFFDLLQRLQSPSSDPQRYIAVAGFTDRMHHRYKEADWLEVFDLEFDMHLFGIQLPNRYVPIDVDEFIPETFLNDSGLFDKLDAA